MKKKREDRSRTPGGERFHSPFEALAVKREELPALPSPAPLALPRPVGPARAVVSFERKGRGGKEVTILEGMALGPEQRQRWLSELKAALGCGGTLEGEALILQGDQRSRIRELLRARGVGRVVGV